MKIYTKTGDTGDTGLFGGGRVPKSHPRVEAYGDVDELNATIGVARAAGSPPDPQIDALLVHPAGLFAIGALLATPDRERMRMHLDKAKIDQERVAELERAIDAADAELEPLAPSFSWRLPRPPRSTSRACTAAPTPDRSIADEMESRRSSSFISTGSPICCSARASREQARVRRRDGMVTAAEAARGGSRCRRTTSPSPPESSSASATSSASRAGAPLRRRHRQQRRRRVRAARAQALGAERAAVFTVPAGGRTRRERAGRVTDALFAARFGRDSAIVALGGGVIGDLAGFVAATFMRGIPFVQVPTTLLAMIDASVGGKTGVDTPAGKNLVGAFHQPAAVVADLRALATLPSAQLTAGMAEAIKHGVIADAAYFDSVAAVAERIDEIDVGGARMLDLVARSIEIKADVVRRDEREMGLRKILNFGHTIGHAIEHMSGYSILHGEAVAVGMVLESRIAERLGVADSGTASRVESAVRAFGLPASLPSRMPATGVIEATHGDKKARGGEAEYALPTRIGTMAAENDGWAVAVSMRSFGGSLTRLAACYL
jgi:3-dehydroquinate synthase